MTKYKKLTRSSFVIVALCLALVGILAFGGTYAYFSAEASATGTVTAKTLKLTKSSDLSVSATGKIVPNQSVSYNLAEGDIKLTGDTISVLRITLSDVTVTPADTGTTLDKSLVTVSVTGKVTSDWTRHTDGNYYYLKTVTGGMDLSTILTSVGVKLDSSANNDWQGAEISYGFTVQAVQYEYVGDNVTVNSGTPVEVIDAATAFTTVYPAD